jgi:hypothetical protein
LPREKLTLNKSSTTSIEKKKKSFKVSRYPILMDTTWEMRVLLIMSKLSPHRRIEKWSKLMWKIGRRSKLRPQKLYFGQMARK